MKRILIRCDASLLIGSGHVIRCRTLARELQRRGADVWFLCRRQPGDLINLLEPEFAVLALPEQPLVACDGLEGRDLYGAWLGCTQVQDAAQCLELLAHAGITDASWIVVDHYGLDSRWEAQLLAGLSGTQAAPKLLVIDDLADRTHQADVLLDQNFFGQSTQQRYDDLVPHGCSQLLGPNYALLAPEYEFLHPIVPSRKELKRILIYFGGIDEFNLTCLCLEALSDSNFLDLAVDVVAGQQDTNYENIQEIVSSRPNTTLHKSLPSLAGLIARADLSIGAGGSTTWERACLGLPTLVIATAANQLSFSESLNKFGYIKLLTGRESVTKSQIYDAVNELRDNLINYSSCKNLTDGRGAMELAKILLVNDSDDQF